VFYALGSDGTVGANKESVKIIGDEPGQYAQGYFVYDSKKSGSMTVSHLRYGPEPIRSTYLVDRADFVACHQFGLLDRFDVLEQAAHGGAFLLNAPYPADEVWSHLPPAIRREIVDRELRVFTIDAARIARELGMPGRINTVMQPCFFALSGVLEREQAVAAIKRSIEKTYGRRGRLVVERNQAAVDRALDELVELTVPADGAAETIVDAALATLGAEPDSFVERVTAMLVAGRGDQLPVSALPVDGTFPTGTTRFEKRKLAAELPIWEPDLCIDCGKCAIVCPHAAIRMKAYPAAAIDDRPRRLPHQVVPVPRAGSPPAHRAGRARRLHRLRCVRRRVPGQGQVRAEAQGDQHARRHRAPRRRARALGLLPRDPRARPHRGQPRHREEQPAAATAVRVLGRVLGLRRDAVPQAAHPALR
jgi:pyruvate-ferredoxin/flavodoxin oxidoreductase